MGIILNRTDGATRLVSRNRIATPGAPWLARAVSRYLMEPGSLVMERKMLHGIRHRAQRLAIDNPTGAVGPGSMTVFSSVYASTAIRPRVTDASQLGELGLAAGVGVNLCAVDEHAHRAAEHVERIA